MQLDDAITSGDAASAELCLEQAWKVLRTSASQNLTVSPLGTCLDSSQDEPTGDGVVDLSMDDPSEHDEDGLRDKRDHHMSAITTLEEAPSGGLFQQEEGGGLDDNNRKKGPQMTSPLRVGDDATDFRPLFLRRFCAAWVYTGMCCVGVSLLERDKK